MRDTALCQGDSITYITLHAWGESKYLSSSKGLQSKGDAMYV